MADLRLLISHGGQWCGQNYEGGDSKMVFVPRNLTYDGLIKTVKDNVPFDLPEFNIELRAILTTSGRRTVVRIKNNIDVSFMMQEERVIPEAYVTIVGRDQATEDKLKNLTENRMKNSNVNIGHYRPLVRAIQENDFKTQKDFLDNNPDAMKVEIDEFGSTVFHLIVQQSVNSATVKLLEELVSKVSVDSPETLEIKTVAGLTALDIAASAGNTKAVKLFVEKYKRLLSSEEEQFDHPVLYAAYWGRKETVIYLLSLKSEVLTDEDFFIVYGDTLLKTLIGSNLQGIALGLLKHYPQLAGWEENLFWNDIVCMLSEKHLAFKSGRRLGFWESLIYHYIPVNDDEDHIDWPKPPSVKDLEKQSQDKSSSNSSEESQIPPQKASTIDTMSKRLYSNALVQLDALNKRLRNALIKLAPSWIKRIHDQKLLHRQTLKIVRMMFSKVDWTYKEASERLKNPVLIAARLGIHEFVSEVLKAYPNSVLFYDKKGRNIFLLAVLHRQEKVFNLIHDRVASIRDHNNYVKEKEVTDKEEVRGQNILHLAGKLVPSTRVPGPALQMQRELQWFQGIRDLFETFLQEQRNGSRETPDGGKTPGEVFTEEHRDLMKAGEEWMRQTATSCSVVAALIITIVFAAAFTLPGGLESKDIHNYLTEFRTSAISVAIAMFASTTSVHMFLGILTSCYREEDFLEALPRKLIIGLFTLFLSSSSMMVAFGAAFSIVISHPWKWLIILICALGCLPVTLFAWMQFPLLLNLIIFTYGPNIVEKSKSTKLKSA